MYELYIIRPPDIYPTLNSMFYSSILLLGNAKSRLYSLRLLAPLVWLVGELEYQPFTQLDAHDGATRHRQHRRRPCRSYSDL